MSTSATKNSNSRATKWRVYSNPISELTDAATRDLCEVSRPAPLPDQGEALHNCAQLDGHYRHANAPHVLDVHLNRLLAAECAREHCDALFPKGIRPVLAVLAGFAR